MKWNKLAGLIAITILAVGMTACTKVKSTPKQSISLSGARPTLNAKVATPGTTGLSPLAAPSITGTPVQQLAIASNNTAVPTAAASDALAPTPTIAPTATPQPQYRTHIVAWGDTLLSIAMLYGARMEDIISANNLSNNVIQIGQALKIPMQEIPAGAQTYVVKYGDSIAGIAALYNIDMDTLMRANNITNGYYLQVGQTLVIPTNGQQVAQNSNNVQAASTGQRSHIVQPGDTLFSIALFYNVDAYQLALANNLANPNLLQVGQKLIIP